jgi:hypothetical protein
MVIRWAVCIWAGCALCVRFAGPACAQAGSEAAGEPSLARLLSPRPVQADAAAQLAQVLGELERRPEAPAAREALAEAHAALDALSTRQSDPAGLIRQKQWLWAALLLADRLIARAEHAAARNTLQRRTELAEAAVVSGPPSSSASHVEGVPATADRPADAARTARLAPDLAARAQRARAAAKQAATPEAQKDHTRRAQLLQLAALAEADRVAIEREIARLEERMALAVTAHAVAQRAQLTAASEHERQRAAAQERAEADRVFDALARPATLRGGAAGNGARDEARLWRRAQARFAAALALDAQAAESVDRATQLAPPSGALAKQASRSVGSAKQALALAERALGAARKASSPPGLAQARDLVQRAAELGFSAELLVDGVAIHAAHVFVPGRAAVQPEMQRRLQLLRELLPAYPHGSIRIACVAASSSSAELGLARARAARTAELLVQSSERARWQLDEPLAASPEQAELRILFGAYAGALVP